MDIPVLQLISRSGVVAKIILLLLTILSLVTWAIIFNRMVFYRRIKNLGAEYRKIFDTLKSINQIDTIDKKLEQSPLGQLGRSCLCEYRRIITDAKNHSSVKDWSFYLQNQFFMASDHINATTASVASKLDSGVHFLAIASSSAPFLGLLGTVWGIMDAFFEIGNQGSASLPVVAPGIAEALITTIFGLAVAIPSVFFFNMFNHRLTKIEDELDEFAEHLVLRLKRELFTLLYSEKMVKE